MSKKMAGRLDLGFRDELIEQSLQTWIQPRRNIAMSSPAT